MKHQLMFQILLLSLNKMNRLHFLHDYYINNEEWKQETHQILKKGREHGIYFHLPNKLHKWEETRKIKRLAPTSGAGLRTHPPVCEKLTVGFYQLSRQSACIELRS